jgi:methyl-accepting chemotaxis protein
MIKALDDVSARFDDYYATGQLMAHAYVSEGPTGGNALMPKFDAAADGITTAVEATGGAMAELVKVRQAERVRLQAEATAEQRMALMLTAAAAVFTAAGGVIVILLLRGRLLRPLGALVGYMGLLAAGDYQTPVPVAQRSDELGDMVKAIGVFRAAGIERRDIQLAREAEQAAARSAESERQTERQAAETRRAAAVALLAQGLNRLSDGDVAYRIEAEIAPEYIALKNDFNAAADKLRTAMRRIGDASAAVGSSADEIATAADSLSQRTERQAASLEQTAAALEEITVNVKQTAGRSVEVRTVVSETTADAQATEKTLNTALTAVGEIAASSREIGQIVGVIDEIAFQTNLLALNAGVEAARAGDSGRGFAVVASEVRALAQRSGEAAKQIKTLIQTSAGHVDQGVALVSQTGEALARMLKRIESISQIVLRISAATQEQASGLAEVNAAVNDMDQATQQNAAMVEETTAALQTLKDQFNTLSDEVGSFRLGAAALSPRPVRRAA